MLLTEDGQAKLADFGLGAVALNQLGAEGLLSTFAGTANCAAPEVLMRKSGYAGAPADIWSLGMLSLHCPLPLPLAWFRFEGANRGCHAFVTLQTTCGRCSALCHPNVFTETSVPFWGLLLPGWEMKDFKISENLIGHVVWSDSIY